MITHGTTSTIMRPDHLIYSPAGDGLTMQMDQTPCGHTKETCCCEGKKQGGVSSLFPCVPPNASTPRSDRACALWASSHLLSKQRYGYGTYESEMRFASTPNAKMFLVVGDNYLTPPHQEIDIVLEDYKQSQGTSTFAQRLTCVFTRTAQFPDSQV